MMINPRWILEERKRKRKTTERKKEGRILANVYLCTVIMQAIEMKKILQGEIPNKENKIQG